jgi:monoamine oxidase
VPIDPGTISAGDDRPFDVLIIGGGVAGLACAVELSTDGRSICLLEARDRIGGRIFTHRDNPEGFPIELGAEFIHGKAPETFETVDKGQLAVVDVTARHWQLRDGVLVRAEEYWLKLDAVMERLAKDEGPDREFRAFLNDYMRETGDEEAKSIASAFVQGFHAAPVERAGIHGLKKAYSAADKIDGDRSFRIVGGYDAYLDVLLGLVKKAAASISLNTVVTEVRWGREGVEVLTRRYGREKSFHARTVVITLPLGVLKQGAAERGAVRFLPPLTEKKAAIHALEVGNVFRIAMRFRKRFWEELSLPGKGGPVSLEDLGFLHSQDEPVPTWWTQLPIRTPVLVGWAGGPKAESLCSAGEDEALEAALSSLANITRLGRGFLDDLLKGVYFHNWSKDPFARGAYSYVPVNGLSAEQRLASPVENVLFFAGEATNTEGHFGTVHGAFATGRRAAREVLAKLRET